MQTTILSTEGTSPKRYPYKNTIILAALLLGYDVILSGQGFLSVFLLIFGIPVMVIRALLVWKNRSLFWRRSASIGIYLGVVVVIRLLITVDQRGAKIRAEQVIEACEKHKQATGEYPVSLDQLIPKFLTQIPNARKLGMMTQSTFQYYKGASESLTSTTNAHVLVYTSIPPFGKSYYVFEEQRWGFYD